MIRRLLVAAILSTVFTACSYRPTFVGLYDFGDEQWTMGQNVVFDFQTLTTSNAGEMRLAVRYLPSAVGQRANVMIKTVDRNNVYFIDTLSVTLGRGTGGNVRSQEFLVRRGIVWPSSTPHYISLSTDRTLLDIVSLSLQIDNAR